MIQTHIRYKSLSLNQLISDLIWIINAKSLIRSELPEFKGSILNSIQDLINPNEYQLWLNDLLKSPSKLKDYFDIEEQLILGKYLEKLLNFFFSEYPSFDLIYSGKQIFEERTTIGELDFVLKDKRDNRIFHIELTVKYYMGYKNVGKHDLWIGPNGTDTLQKKLNKLDKQLLLSKELEFDVDENQVLIVGYFFKHWKSNKWPYFYSERKGEGLWLYEKEMTNFFSKDKYYSIIPKNRWLSFYFDDQTSVKDGKDIQEEVSQQIQRIGKGIMIAEVDKSRNLLEKCIVAPNKWPSL